MKWLVKYIIRPKWIAICPHDLTKNKPQLGLKIFGVIVCYDKGEPAYYGKHLTELPANHWDFGDSIHPSRSC